MKNHLLKRILSLLLVAALLAGYYVPGAQAASSGLTWKESDQKIKLDLTERQAELHVEAPYAPTDMVRVSIVLEEKSTIKAGFATRNIAENSAALAYSRSLRAKQETMANTISAQVLGGKKLDVVWNLTLVGNIISANVPYGKLEAIEKVDGVAQVVLENIYEPCVIDRGSAAEPQMYASLRMTGSSLAWSSGYTGAGSRVAVIDTGTDTSHQSLDAGAFLYSLEQNALAEGISYESYLAELDLLDTREIAAVLGDLNIYEKDSSLTAAKLYINEKLPFAVNYIDSANRRLVVDHMRDDQGEHGSHVAGITTANRYIPSGSGYADALRSVMMAGTAPDAQLITMKVFGYNGGPSDADYLAAVEDAILLGCDAVNLSLGSAVAGNGTSTYFADILNYLTTTDTVVVASAGNSFSWADATTHGYLYSRDVNLDTVGSPGSYYSFLSVASVENDGGVGPAFLVGDRVVGYIDDYYNCYPFTDLDTSYDGSGTAYEYVFIDGLGYAEDYTGIDLEGKIVFCSRGDLNFGVKANNAVDLGAAATVIYNNQPGALYMDLAGYYYYNPCVSITQADANAIRNMSQEKQTAAGLTYYTGTMTVLGQYTGIMYNSEYLTMSDFSSWGVPGDLSIKPEITAPGGMIYSIYGKTPYGGGSDQYELMSGTSMAAPAVTGMAALLAQYLRETGLAEQAGMSVRQLAQSLLMSTAVPMMEEDSGSYYSILKQGAGLARADLATSADSYILVNGQSDGRVKAELGDDPDRTGVYTFSFSINNLTDRPLSYTLSAELFRQDEFDYGEASADTPDGFTMLDTWTTGLPGTATFTADGVTVASRKDLSGYDLNGDGKTDAADADYLLEYLLGNETTLHGEGDVSGDGDVTTYDAHVLLTLLSGNADVTVPAGGSVAIGVTLTLTESAKALLDEKFENGTYVEAFVYAESVSTGEGLAGTTHSIPVLAFYGNWSDPNMFDYGSYVELEHDYSGLTPYLYYQIGSGNALTIDYGDGEEYYFGGNPIEWGAEYLPERNAFNSEDASYLLGQYFTLIRSAVDTQLVISNADTGEVYMQRGMGERTPAYYYVNAQRWMDTQQGVNVGWTGTDASGDPLPEGTNVEVSLIAVPEYYRNEDGTINYKDLGEGVYLTTPFTIDNTAPELLDMNLEDTTLTVESRDNQYVAGVILMSSNGGSVIAYGTPNQTAAQTDTTVELDLTNVMGKKFQLVVCDYAMNQSVYEITLDLPEPERPYFTVVDYPSSTYYGLDANGNSIALATGDRGVIQAVEFVDGYVFEITADGSMFYASDDDLNNFRYLTRLDSAREYGITYFTDLAYNYADGKLYGLFYASVNYEFYPYLCTIDMFTGAWQVLGELPVDVNNMTIDDEGNFYSVGFNTPDLYTYTLEDLANGNMSYVGHVGYYATADLNSLAWDHNTDTLYWAYPGILLRVDHETGTPTLLSYFNYTMTGLYIRPETWDNRFEPTDKVSSMTMDPTESRVPVGQTLSLTAQILPWNVSDQSITWSSANPAVATVNADGVVTGVSEGQTTITATSNLDPTKSASCTLYVEELDKTMNAIVWDEDGYIWWSEFTTTTLPDYTKLTEESAVDYVASTAILDGELYAATADMTTGEFRSIVYRVDPDSFELTGVGVSSVGYTDIAPAPHIKGGCLAATYGTYILFVDPDTGEFYSGYGEYFDMFSYQVVGIAYAGSTPYQDYGYDSVIDWFYIVDTEGYVYLLGWLEQDGQLYWIEHPDTYGGVFTATNVKTDTPYFCSLYTDGEFLYYSCYNKRKNNSTLYAIDTMGSRECYTLGNFGDGVWPAGGLVELDALSANADILNVAPTMEPKAAENSGEIAALRVAAPENSGGGVNAVSDTSSGSAVDTRSAGEFAQDTGVVTVTLTPAKEDPNGRMTVTYDDSGLKLTGVAGHTDAFAWRAEDGTITVAFASANNLAESQCVATLTFEVLTPGEHTVTVAYSESGSGASSKVEKLTISCGCAHSYRTAIVEPTCTEGGYTTYTCTNCGDSYVDDYVDALGHDYEAVVTKPTCTEGGYTTYTCTRCDDSYVGDYVDALGHDYEAVVTKPTCEEGGYTTYTCTRCDDSYVGDYVDALGHDYEAVVTEPTCTEKGYTTYTCANCGDSYVSDYTDTVAHVYEDGYCKWCGEEVDAVRWDIGTASLNGTIDLVMYVFLSEELVNDPETFARFTFENRVVDVPIAQAEKTVQEDGTIRCRFSCPLFAKQLADAVDVQIMRGETPVGRAVKFSVMQYCQTMLQLSDNPKLHDMCKAMLNYGAAAQQIFDYNIDNLANAILSEEEKELPTPDLSAYKHSVSGSEAGIRPTIATLTLESEIRIRVYFKLDEGRSIDEYTFTVDGVEVQPGHNASGWYIETTGIPAKRMEEMHEFKVGGLTVRYCALSYANQTISSAKPLEANMAKALYAYYAAAEAIFG